MGGGTGADEPAPAMMVQPPEARAMRQQSTPCSHQALLRPLLPPEQAEIPEQAAMRIGGVDGFVPYRAAATLLATALSPPPSIGAFGEAARQPAARLVLDCCIAPPCVGCRQCVVVAH